MGLFFDFFLAPHPEAGAPRRRHPFCGNLALTLAADAAIRSVSGNRYGATVPSMDPIATALTAAWLDAVRRVQSERVQRLEDLMPDAPTGGARNLTDLIEGGLKAGGAAPLNESDTDQRATADARPTIHLVDVLV